MSDTPVTLIDDVYDVLEGTLDEVTRERASAPEGVEQLIVNARVRDARCAVAMLSGLMRGGLRWRPAEDGHDASEWRDILSAVHTDDYTAEYRALIKRELDELVSLAKPGPRRPLPPGTFERRARAAGVSRCDCRTWAREAGDDLVAGWNACRYPRPLVRISLAFGVTPAHIVHVLCDALRKELPKGASGLGKLLEAAPDATLDRERIVALCTAAKTEIEIATTHVLLAQLKSPLTAMRLELMLDSAWRVLDLDELRERIATPQMRALLRGKAN